MQSLHKDYLVREYTEKRKSVSQIAKNNDCSENKINYWMKKFNIPKRTISDAIYIKNNPCGDPFKFIQPKTKNEWFLYGLGLGLYWGEGNKANKHSVRLGNTDPYLIKKFLEFLKNIYQVDTTKLRYGIQIFTDTSESAALNYWIKALGVPKKQFYKITKTKSGSIGTYRQKNEYGVLTIYFSNVRLRDMICSAIQDLK